MNEIVASFSFAILFKLMQWESAFLFDFAIIIDPYTNLRDIAYKYIFSYTNKFFRP